MEIISGFSINLLLYGSQVTGVRNLRDVSTMRMENTYLLVEMYEGVSKSFEPQAFSPFR